MLLTFEGFCRGSSQMGFLSLQDWLLSMFSFTSQHTVIFMSSHARVFLFSVPNYVCFEAGPLLVVLYPHSAALQGGLAHHRHLMNFC